MSRSIKSKHSQPMKISRSTKFHQIFHRDLQTFFVFGKSIQHILDYYLLFVLLEFTMFLIETNRYTKYIYADNITLFWSVQLGHPSYNYLLNVCYRLSSSMHQSEILNVYWTDVHPSHTTHAQCCSSARCSLHRAIHNDQSTKTLHITHSLRIHTSSRLYNFNMPEKHQ